MHVFEGQILRGTKDTWITRHFFLCDRVLGNVTLSGYGVSNCRRYDAMNTNIPNLTFINRNILIVTVQSVFRQPEDKFDPTLP